MRYDVSVIMPALNEEQGIAGAIENVLQSFEKLGCNGQIIVINDGSTDSTPSIVREFTAKCSFLTMVSHPEPKGIGGSFWRGASESESEAVVLIPGDGEIDSSEILRYLPLMKHVDIVIPFVFNREVRSFSRRLISRLYTSIINLSFGMHLNYTNGTVIYRRAVLGELGLANPGFFYQTELLVKALKRGYLYAEVPYALKPRIGGESKALSLKSFGKVLKGYTSLMISTYLSGPATKTISPVSVTAWRRGMPVRPGKQ